MRKSKIVLILVLLMAITMTCIESGTFSWFKRPNSQTGKSLAWSVAATQNVLGNTATDGLSFVTYSGTKGDDGVINYNEAANVTSFSDASTGIAANGVKYYHTIIKNSNSAARSVSLYFPSLSFPSSTTKTKFCLGVNGPTRSYHAYGPNSGVTETDVTKVKYTAYNRVYFEPKGADANWSMEDSYRVFYDAKGDGQIDSDKGLKRINTTGYFFVDLPQKATKIFFANSSYTGSESYRRTQTMEDIKADGVGGTSCVMYCNDGTTYTSPHNNKKFNPYTFKQGVDFRNYYEKITVRVGQTFEAGLTWNSDYIGDDSSINYYIDSSETGIVAMDNGTTNGTTTNTTGKIKAKSVGTATMYTKIKGIKGTDDNLQVTTTINVLPADAPSYTYTDVPLVTNLRVPGAQGTEENKIDGAVDVYWFIKNDSSNTSTGNMKFTMANLDLTL